jgi:hypothetical protein
MTLIEILFFLICLAAGVFTGHWCLVHYGWLGGGVGLILGFGGAMVVFRAIARIAYQWHIRSGVRPGCPGKGCGGKEYSSVEYKNGDLIWSCDCGRKFVRRKRKFLQIEPDGTLKPYMKKSILRGWVADPDA